MSKILSCSIRISLTAIAGGIIAIYYVTKLRKKRRNLPPTSPCSALAYIKNAMNQKGTECVEFIRDLGIHMERAHPNSEILGTTFVQSLVFWNPLIITTDYKLGRLVLGGGIDETGSQIQEGERSFFYEAFNVLDSSVYNLISHLTSNVSRNGARKSYIKAFSTNNLRKGWEKTEIIVHQQLYDLQAFAQASATDSKHVVDLKDVIIHLFIRVLGQTTYGIQFTTDGSEPDNAIDGVKYVACQEAVARAKASDVLNPFSPLLFWTTEQRTAARARTELLRMATKMLRLCHERRCAEDTEEGQKESAGQREGIYLLDFIADQPYESEMGRLADVILMAQAAHETTAHSLLFLLMEVSRPKHNEIRKKLYAELDGILPSSLDNACSSDATSGILSSLMRAEYLSWCIKETMRLWPIAAGGIERQMLQDVVHEGMLIPCRAHVLVNFFGMFRHTSIDRPYEFVPERWAASSPQSALLHEMVFPFSTGKRSCLGQNMAQFQLHVLGAYLLKYFAFEQVSEPELEYAMTLKMMSMKVRLAQRVSASR